MMAYNRYKLSRLGAIVEEKIASVGKTARVHLHSDSTLARESANTAIFAKKAIMYLVKKALLVLIAYLFGSAGALFDTYPLGIALLCAAKKDIVFIFVGDLLAALTLGREASAFFFIYTACVLLRAAFSKWMGRDTFDEPFALRLITLILCSFSVGFARFVSDGFLYYDLFALIFALVCSPMAFAAFYYPICVKQTSTHMLKICSAVYIFAFVYSLKLYYVFGFSAAIMAGALITMYVSMKLGVLHGCACGLFAGLACGMSMAPMLAFVGLVFGSLVHRSLFAAVGSAVFSGVVIGVASNGFSSMSVLLPDLALSGIIFLPLSHYELLPATEFFLPETVKASAEAENAIISESKLRDNTEMLKGMSDSFAALSETIAALSDRLRRPDVLDIKAICEESFREHCEKCSLVGICYGRDCAQTFDVIGKLASVLGEKGHADIADIPMYFSEKCLCITRIVSKANLSYSKHLERLIKLDKTYGFSVDYKALSALIAKACKTNDDEYELDTELMKKLLRALKYTGIDAERAYVYGKRKKHITVTGIRTSRIKMNTQQMRGMLENVCGCRLTLPIFELDGDKAILRVESECVYEVQTVKKSLKMSESEQNGDTSTVFKDRAGNSYMLISDGMGSGREAAMTSRICAVFLSKLLSAGCSIPIVLEMLNGFIRSKSEECSASIDLACFDLLTGKGRFIKSGAAPSYILRDKNLYKLQSKTMPIGILRETDAEIINFELHDGDIIVMFSDGVASSLEDGVWLTSLLCFDLDDDLTRSAEKILEYAERVCGRIDDMTVALVRVKKIRRDEAQNTRQFGET